MRRAGLAHDSRDRSRRAVVRRDQSRVLQISTLVPDRVTIPPRKTSIPGMVDSRCGCWSRGEAPTRGEDPSARLKILVLAGHGQMDRLGRRGSPREFMREFNQIFRLDRNECEQCRTHPLKSVKRRCHGSRRATRLFELGKPSDSLGLLLAVRTCVVAGSKGTRTKSIVNDSHHSNGLLLLVRASNDWGRSTEG